MSTLTESERFHLKKFVKELSSYSARHTEFVSVYIPAGYDLNKIINHLYQEQGTATNIKSAGTRKNVIDALERMIQHLKLFKRTPPNGLAVFAGNIDSKEGGHDVKVWSVEPSIPIKARLYRCEKKFQLEILDSLLETREIYGLVVIDARDTIVALLKGKAIVPLVKKHSHIPGKMRAGGQSSVRFARNREIAIKAHIRKAAEIMKEQFLSMKNLKGILVGGPGPIKFDLCDGGFLTGDIKKKVIAVKDLSYTEEPGLTELVDRCQDVLANEAIAGEKKIVNKFLELLARNPDLVAYGEVNVRRALELGAVETLMLSEAMDEQKLDEFEAIAKSFNTTVQIISTDTREGVQLRDLGMLGAILRYKLQ